MRAPERLSPFTVWQRRRDGASEGAGRRHARAAAPGNWPGGEGRDVILLIFTLGDQSFQALNGGAKASIRNVTALPEFVAAAAPAGLSGPRRLIGAPHPTGGIFPLLCRNYSPVIPLLFRCYGRTSSAVRAEFVAGSRGGDRGFSAVSLPRGFRMRRGERRSAMLPQLENPMIFLFENIKVWHDYFSGSESEAPATRLADCPLSSAQVLENSQNGKGWLLARVGMDLGSAPRSLGLGAVLRPVS